MCIMLVHLIFDTGAIYCGVSEVMFNKRISEKYSALCEVINR
jgi:hypothetical protein